METYYATIQVNSGHDLEQVTFKFKAYAPHTWLSNAMYNLGFTPVNYQVVKLEKAANAFKKPTQIDDGMGGTYTPGVIISKD